MNQSAKRCQFGVLCGVCVTVLWAQAYAQPVDWKAPLVTPALILIQDKAIRSELAVNNEQIEALDRLSKSLDPLLFAMRDVPADTKDPQAIVIAKQIKEKLRELDSVLSPRQQNRLDQLSLQYEGFDALARAGIQAKLRLRDTQIEQIRSIRDQSLQRQQQESKQQPSNDRDAAALQREIQVILQQQAQQILQVFSSKQRLQWQNLLGEPFDFSQLSPFSFPALELQNVTAWINTEPVSMQGLRGRVVVVHFWTFGCSNCIQNYPVYKQWTKQYNPKEVLILGIHTPEAEYEKDLQALQKRIKQEELTFAVAVDNDKANWKLWSNHMWPSVYLVDKKGRVRYWWYGELRWQGAKGDQLMTQHIEELRAER